VSSTQLQLTLPAVAAAANPALYPPTTTSPGNPEEGELRPQLLDRFGMHAQIGTVKDPELRVQIVSERSTFDENPSEFHKKYAEKQVRPLLLFGGSNDSGICAVVELRLEARGQRMPFVLGMRTICEEQEDRSRLFKPRSMQGSK
jgi:hypothetical protein